MCPLTSNGDSNSSDLTKNSILLETGEFPKEPIIISILGKKFLVFNNIHGSLLYGFNRYYGTPVGIKKPKSHIFDTPLELTPYEVFYLFGLGKVKVKNEKESFLEEKGLFDYLHSKFPDFEYKYIIYKDLREKKYIPRPGQKFGADFIVYEKGPGLSHSSFCIIVQTGAAAKISSLDVVTAGRLATSVKKNFILANPLSKQYYKFKWFKP